MCLDTVHSIHSTNEESSEELELRILFKKEEIRKNAHLTEKQHVQSPQSFRIQFWTFLIQQDQSFTAEIANTQQNGLQRGLPDGGICTVSICAFRPSSSHFLCPLSVVLLLTPAANVENENLVFDMSGCRVSP